ncbi:hypothetical protein BGZ99_010075 [Dissophora globulifera]|uniref:DNA-(apurinic or apyrimidinic site) endonuclease n=1 Tax=Dissophora globulifera TaxID=979702 RepID=A0A9P6ULE5_9FUNG|nr:hypothetical protein BGZ99_010075 [Dissophora globulifera]
MVTKRNLSTSATSGASSESPSSKRARSKVNYNEDHDDDNDQAEDDDDEVDDKPADSKKKGKVAAAAATPATSKTSAPAKKGTETKKPIRSGAPVNTTMPNPLVLPKTPEGCIKITSWNVSGLNASLKKGYKTYITAEDADVICLQEHKVNQPLLNLVDPKVYPFSWWGFEADKKGYAGVAMFSKTVPLEVTAGLPTHPDPSITKGRIVTLEFPTCFLLGCYVPNAGEKLVRLKERMVWDVAMKAWILQLKAKGKHIIWTGDLNVCHKPIDLRNPSTNLRSAGFTQEERDGFSAILKEAELVDTFREIQGEGQDVAGQYSYYSYRFQCRIKGIGWRLDYFVTDKDFQKERVVESVIREECYGASDHVPIVLIAKGTL